MAEDDIKFDFESVIEPAQNALPSTAGPSGRGKAPDLPPGTNIGQSLSSFKRNYRQTVCTYWLRGLCMKGDTCGFLHQFDPERMPVCRTLLKFGQCKEPDCPYKHTLDDIKECNMYKLGFCIYGPQCRYKHPRAEGPPPDPHTTEAAKPKEFRSAMVDDGSTERSHGPRHGGGRGRGRGGHHQLRDGHRGGGGGGHGGGGAMVAYGQRGGGQQQHGGRGSGGGGAGAPASLPNSDMLAAVGQQNLPYGF